MSGIIINVRTVGRKCATFKYVTGPFALGRSFSGTTGSKDTTGVGTPRPPEMPNMPDMATLMKDPGTFHNYRKCNIVINSIVYVILHCNTLSIVITM